MPDNVLEMGERTTVRMPDFETYTCNACGEEFRAYPDANAAQNGYCSPKCQTSG